MIFLKCLLSSLALSNVLQAEGPYRKCPLPPSSARDIPLTSSDSWWIVVVVVQVVAVVVRVLFWMPGAVATSWLCCNPIHLFLRGGDSVFINDCACFNLGAINMQIWSCCFLFCLFCRSYQSDHFEHWVINLHFKYLQLPFSAHKSRKEGPQSFRKQPAK